MSLVRRKAIYAVAQKHNLAIIEDDPYYFLQLPEFVATSATSTAAAADGTTSTTTNASAAVCNRPQILVPSLLSMDIDGRVIRLDSFSKILAPNLRCGWITAPRYILDKIQILNETTTLQPSGVSQGLISKMLNDVWGMDGWNAHLQELRSVYTRRRNIFIQMVEKHLAGLVEYSVPMAGMFVWMKINFGAAAADQTAMPRLLDAMKKCGVMMAPGMPFSSNGLSPSDHYLRAAFALVDVDMFEPALARLAQAITGISGRVPAASSDAVKASLIVPTSTSLAAVNSSG
ncbi:Aromatic/aminoadipate aminotransferase 1 [Coemansia interrupta]|uniref:Aromatic/aminoadipate aminotransferase 1 n=1 Tax=Coemansia interrupta TaxID=1126814 RepID=A0A9W8HFK3_9FUNG|nr:Aromatic/aminoadipate aminotransferase 1 [Coemansia interrupta]